MRLSRRPASRCCTSEMPTHGHGGLWLGVTDWEVEGTFCWSDGGPFPRRWFILDTRRDATGDGRPASFIPEHLPGHRESRLQVALEVGRDLSLRGGDRGEMLETAVRSQRGDRNTRTEQDLDRAGILSRGQAREDRPARRRVPAGRARRGLWAFRVRAFRQGSPRSTERRLPSESRDSRPRPCLGSSHPVRLRGLRPYTRPGTRQPGPRASKVSSNHRGRASVRLYGNLE
jgi:hypothetical protein